MKSIVRIKFGSHLYGTNTPTSDTDYKSVHIPDGRSILLQRPQDSVGTKVKRDGEKNSPEDVDDESYSLQRFLGLAAEGQTACIDMLFASPQSLVATSRLWEFIIANRHRLLTKKSAAFVGYCRQQANKYGIKGSRVAAAKKATDFFAKAIVTVGSTTKLWEIASMVRELTDEHTQIIQQVVNRAGDLGTFLECCNRKVDFNSTCKQAHEVFSRIYENYGNRARLAQTNEGVDWKALSHAVRVALEAIELLTTGHITFPLYAADHILAIKQGRLSYGAVSSEIEQLLVQVENAALNSLLPDQPDIDFIETLVLSEYAKAVQGDR
jgi:hypothetical protein